MMETFPAQGPVRTKVIGKETPVKRDAAQRVQEDMNHQLTDVMVEYRPEHERMLWGLGLAGNAFKKVYYDPSIGRQVAMYVPADDVVVPYGASSLEVAGRVTHVMRKTPNELKKLQRDGFYRDADIGEPTNTLDEIEKKIAEKLGFRAETDDRYKLLEMHVDLVIEDDKYRDDDDADVAVVKVLSAPHPMPPDEHMGARRAQQSITPALCTCCWLSWPAGCSHLRPMRQRSMKVTPSAWWGRSLAVIGIVKVSSLES
jgi:hypothetical protein